MPSILPNFEYDIFISYRHNDNRSGWVTEFVKALQEELASTVKDPVSVYFDTNPHDGLLETHHVDKSLEGKLKCLIFIPVISQTYCDPKSFAWQHEFVAFNKLAKEDSFGRDIKLNNGNVTSRILPIKIHDLDEEDKATIETEISGVLRAIEFIYKEPGVNRPLKLTDNKNENQRKTDYRNQVNKVANAVKEIITSLKNPFARTTHTTTNEHRTNRPSRNRKPVLISIGLLFILVSGYFIYQQLFNTSEPPSALEKSIAVLPFVDLSEQKDQGWFGDGLTEEVLNSLAHVKGLKVTSRTSSFAFKNKNIRIQAIADSLGVNYVVEGSVRKVGDGLRITAQLIRAKDDFHIWSNTYDRDSRDIFQLQQEIATRIAESLDISLDPVAVKQMQGAGTTNPEAFLAFLKGRELDEKAHQNGRFIPLAELKAANVFYEQSIKLDPDFVNPYLYHADFFLHYVLADDPQYKDTLTENQAYRMFMADLGNTVSRSKEATQKDYYRLSQIMYSNDWSNFRQAIEKSLNSPDAVKYFRYQNFDISSLLICLGYGDQLIELSRKMLENDPSDQRPMREIVLTHIYSGNYQDALNEIANVIDHSDQPQLYVYKLYCMLQLGQVDEAYTMVNKKDLDYYSYYDIKALVLAKKGLKDEARNIFKTPHRSGPLYLIVVDELFGRQEANRQASLSDQKVLLDFQLFRSYLFSPNKLPFDLSATPNFARRLRQAKLNLN
jgi:TolB-like protein